MKKKWSTPEIREIFVEGSVVKGIEGMEKHEVKKNNDVKHIIEKMLKERKNLFIQKKFIGNL